MSMMATGTGMGKGMTPSLNKGKSKGGLTPFSMQQFTPDQMQLFQQMFGHVGQDSYLSKLAGGDQSQFDQLEAPALKQFSELQGGLASRFSGMGSGAQKSSGFKNTMNQASQDFAGQLQSQRMGIQRQALHDLMGISHELLGQRPYEQFAAPKKKPFWQSLIEGGISGASQFGMSQLGF
jgi:hypothetical protein